jgi:hypothetical protein
MDDLEKIIEKLKDMNPDYEHDDYHDVISVHTDEYKELIKKRDKLIRENMDKREISEEVPF